MPGEYGFDKPVFGRGMPPNGSDIDPETGGGDFSGSAEGAFSTRTMEEPGLWEVICWLSWARDGSVLAKYILG